jgi:NADH:ubiquinone oxidoreductase subunit 6 (subunit J)
MHYILLILGSIAFAILAISAKRLIAAALWLAGVSALVSILFYLFGAQQVAVVELSVGAGLVTVLFVFAISIAGEEPGTLRSLTPRWLGGGLAILLILLLAWFTIPAPAAQTGVSEAPFATVFWQQRGLDVLVQTGLIFAGVLGLLGLLAEAKAPLKRSVAEAVTAKRDRELEKLGRPELEKEAV